MLRVDIMKQHTISTCCSTATLGWFTVNHTDRQRTNIVDSQKHIINTSNMYSIHTASILLFFQQYYEWSTHPCQRIYIIIVAICLVILVIIAHKLLLIFNFSIYYWFCIYFICMLKLIIFLIAIHIIIDWTKWYKWMIHY